MSPVVAISTSSFGVESDQPLANLREAGYQVRLNPHGRKLSPQEAIEHTRGAVGLVAGTEKLDRETLSTLDGLQVISRVGVGIDGIDLQAAKDLGIQVRNTPCAHVDAVAELTLGGLLAAMRHIPRCHEQIRAGTWKKPMGRLLAGKTVGLIGFGKVGQALTELLAPFGGRRVASDPAPDREAASRLRVELVAMETVLAEADVVSLHVPYSQAVHHLLGKEQIALLKKDAVLVNTARGGLLDEGALAEWLSANPKALAYLDCFENEPYDGALRTADNCVLSAHIGSYAREARIRMETEAVDNLLGELTSP